MYSRWFNAAVVMSWRATMSWLVTAKVLPPLLIGEPPNYRSIVEAQRSSPPVGWRVSFDGRPLGWGLSDTTRQQNGLTDIRCAVHFDSVPLKEMMPGWLRVFSQWSREPINYLQMDAESELTIDALGRLVRFHSTVRMDPFDEMIRIRGTTEGRQLYLTVSTGGASFTTETFLPSDALLSDALSPQVQLPGLRIGQTWTVPVYSPLWPSKNPLEIIRATAEGLEPIVWNGVMENAMVVVYRNDSGNGDIGGEKSRGKLWVRSDGTVLRQQVQLFDSMITFDRLPDDEAAELAAGVGRRRQSMDDVLRGRPHD